MNKLSQRINTLISFVFSRSTTRFRIACLQMVCIPILLLSGCNDTNNTDNITSTSDLNASTKLNVEAKSAEQPSVKWTLASFNTPNGTEPTINNTNISLTMDMATNRIHGIGSCNDYSADFVFDEASDSITISNVISTEMWCVEPDGIMQQEQNYFDSLLQVQSLILDYTLTLFIGEGSSLSFFSEQSTQVQSSWKLSSINSASGSRKPIENTEISLTIDSENQLITGVSGCNNYIADFLVSEANNDLDINHVISTEAWCLTPENIMQQEQDYLYDLQNVQSLIIVGNSLTLVINDETNFSFIKK